MVSMRVERAARAVVWDVPAGWVALSSASVGGGLVRPRWVTNLEVGDTFRRTDLAAYAEERAAGLGLRGSGTTLLTAADVTQVEQAGCEGVLAWATVGVTKPTWARPVGGAQAVAPTASLTGSSRGSETGARVGTATPAETAQTTAPAETADTATSAPPPGTINIVLALPLSLTTSALVQAVGTLTEAKTQALIEGGVPGTGTASDAAVVLCPEPERSHGGAAEPFAGVRSPWGRRIAEAVHAAVAAGLAAHPWPPDDVDPSVVW